LALKSTFVGNITGYFSPTVHLSLLEASRVFGDVGALGDVGAPSGASGNFQSRVRSTINLHGCGTYGGISIWAQQKKNKNMHGFVFNSLLLNRVFFICVSIKEWHVFTL
jgi:hypothetical protein